MSQPSKDQYVKCWFRNGFVLEGFVESWSDNKSFLKNHNQEIIIIQHTLDDIMAIKISQSPLVQEKLEEEHHEIKEEIREELNNTFLPISEPTPLDNKKLKVLRELLGQREREIISQKMKSHHADGSKRVKYGHPGFLPQPSDK